MTGRIPEIQKEIGQTEQQLAFHSDVNNAGEGAAVFAAQERERLRELKLDLAKARDEAAESITSASTLTKFFPKGPGQLAGLVGP
jgi:hypothetical protein